MKLVGRGNYTDYMEHDIKNLRKALGILKDVLNMEKTGNYTGDFKEIQVLFDAQSTVIRDRESYNITGMIPGEEPEQVIMLSAH